MPRDYPEWPTGAQVQAYLAAYASHFGLEPALRLSTEVTAAAPAPDGGWAVDRGRALRSARARPSTSTALVVANGVFCEPAVPRYPGEAEFTAAGGRVLPAPSCTTRSRRAASEVLVVGYGKSACDVAVPIERRRGEHRRHRPAAAVEGAAAGRRRPQLQAPAADPHGRGAVPVPAACAASRSSCTGRATACAAA